MTLAEILGDLEDQDGDGVVTLGELVEHFQNRGFGPVLMVPALIAFLPTGGIPTVPTTCGLASFLIATQMALGRSHPWMPGSMRQLELPEPVLRRSVKAAMPWAEWLDGFFQPRLEGLSSDPWDRLAAVALAVLGLTMVPLEIIPWACTLPAFAILVGALGLSTRDGLLILAAQALTLASLYATYRVVL